MFSIPFPELAGFARVLASVALVVIAICISYWWKADLERDLLVATVRAFFQLVAIGYVLQLIFDQQRPLWIFFLLAVMTAIAAYTAGQRGRMIPHGTWLAAAAIGLGAFLTLGILLVLNVFTFDAQTIIPIGGMIIGNAMTTCALVMNRLANDVRQGRHEIEAALALGATSRQAAQPQFRSAVRSAMIPIVDTTKTVGLIKLPGAMTGLILAGVSPLEAVKIQMIVMYMLVGASAFTGLITAYLTQRQFFTAAHQLQHVATQAVD